MPFLNLLEKFSKLSYFPDILNIINLLLILLTVTVSYLSWKSAKKANNLQLLPLLAVYFKGKTLEDRKIRVRNIGKSPAYDIKIESFTNIITDAQTIWKLDLFISGTNVVIPKEEKTLMLHATSNGKKANMEEFMIFYLDPEEQHERKEIELVLTFRNAEGKKYYSKVKTGVGGLIINPAKRLNIVGKLYLKFRTLKERVLLSWFQFKWTIINKHSGRKI